MSTLTDKVPPTARWYWKQTHWDNYRLLDPQGGTHDFRSYADLCWYCGTRGINATQI